MSHAFLNRRHLALVAALTIPFAAAACYAASVHAGTTTHLQNVADNAALAGVNSLAASTGQSADARSAAAITAVQTVVAGQQGAVRTLRTSVDGLTMSVVIEDPAGGVRVTATAQYIPAKDGQPARQASGLGRYKAAAL